MNKLIIGGDDRVGKWVYDRMEGDWTPQRGIAIGLADENGGLVAGVVYENWNETNCFIHIASNGNLRYLPRWFIRYCFHYAFCELGCSRITGMVNSTNIQARKANEFLGMEVEGLLKDALPNGHILIYRMFKPDCRWLSEELNHG